MCYAITHSTAIWQGGERGQKKNKTNQTLPFSVTVELPGIIIITLAINPQRAINQRALPSVIRKSTLHSVERSLLCCLQTMSVTPFPGKEQSNALHCSPPARGKVPPEKEESA